MVEGNYRMDGPRFYEKILPACRWIGPLCALLLTMAICRSVSAEAQSTIADNNLLLNGGFDDASANWSAQGGAYYFYNDGIQNILSLGWWDGSSFWQNSGATIQPGLDYVLTIRAAVGQSPLTAVDLSLQDVTTGWTILTNQNYVFPTQTTDWQIFSLYIPAAAIASAVGDTVGVGGALVENPNSQYGWLWVDWLQLAPAIPQFTSQPQSATGFFHGEASLTATAIGAVTNSVGIGSSLQYQWYKAPATLLANATNSTLTLTNLSSGDAGTYYVVISGPFGSNTSSNATLNVTPLTITLDATNEGRVFEGIGGVSASGTSRLLVDYPEPERSQILDYLFKPDYGAALQHLKVEIGGDINSTDGCEPSHQRTATETNYTRGYEWWLMQQARQRNPKVMLDSLAWGAPGWIGNGNYYSQDMANYIANFLNGAKQVYGLDINYTGVRNETANDPNWIKLLRTTLDADGLQSVKIVAGDEWQGTWNVVNDIISDPVLSNDVYAVGAHYATSSPAAAQSLSQPLWASEDGPGFGDWWNALNLASRYNRNYILRRMTKTEIWCPVTSYYDVLPAAGAGLMRANTPWSGNYSVLPGIWVTAHTTQFAQPGWKYLEGGASALLPQGGSIVTLKSTNNFDWSIVAETSDATVPQAAIFHLTNGLSTGPVHVWTTTQNQQFVQTATISPVNGTFTFSFLPNAIYSLTTTTGQSKGSVAPPPPQPFPLPYQDDFESYKPGTMPRYFSDEAGAFEVAPRADGQGQCLAQVLPQKGIEWTGEFNPYTLIGDSSWNDYEVSTDVRLNTNEWVYIWGRVSSVPGWSSATPNGYWLAVNNNPGGWELRNASGVIISGPVTFAAGVWHHLRLAMQGTWIQAWVDGTRVASISDTSCSSGLAGLGCGWQCFPEFDNFTIRPLHRGEPNLALTATASASSYFDSTSLPSFANDGDFTTRWSASYPTLPNEWLELDFPRPFKYNLVTLTEFGARVQGYHLQHWTGAAWSDDAIGGMIGGLVTNNPTTNAFAMVTSDKERLLVTNMISSPSFYEFQVFNLPQRPGPIRINEWMIDNVNTLVDPADGQFHSWFELYNGGPTNFDLAGYFLAGSPTNLNQFQIPPGYMLAPGSHLLVWADGLPEHNQPGNPDLHVNFTLPQSSIIGLFAADGSQMDAVNLISQPANTSSGSKTDGDLAALPLASPTPGLANNIIKAVSASRSTSDGRMHITFSGLPFASHRIQYSDSLVSPDWQSLTTVIADALGQFSFVDTNALTVNQRFYRAVSP